MYAVCVDFACALVEFNGENNHIHCMDHHLWRAPRPRSGPYFARSVG
ncbi:hypothetical protein [Streptomyces sp. ISL-100]|nr:hypothetical protein [Streptomyces sp. ISL-100]MBT2401847.1 hypothetical protein [Streptomyces sp. ISL-100]